MRILIITWQLILLCVKLPKKYSNKTNILMTNYSLWWTPENQTQLGSDCPFLNLIGGTYYSATPEWPNGFFFLTQDLNGNQFGQCDTEANNYVLIDIKPSPQPPGNPHGR